MITKRIKVDNYVEKNKVYPQLFEAAQFLQEEEVVAFPTETVYGLGGNAKSDKAIEKIFQAKGRPTDNPLIIHIASIDQLHEFVEQIPETAKKLMDKFWPGPLTIIFNKKEGSLSEKATARLNTVAVRMPDHPVALALIKAANLPIAAPSANQSGRPSPTTADHVWEDLNGKIAAIVDGGQTGIGLESTVIDCTGEVVQILRPGGITKEQLEEIVGHVQIDPAFIKADAPPRSPGMKYTHYAPKAPMVIVFGTSSYLQSLVNEKRREGLKVGVLTTEENKDRYEADVVLACGKRKQLETVAQSLFATLRQFDHAQVDFIFSEMFPMEGVGVAIMNRLLKAAGQQIIKE